MPFFINPLNGELEYLPSTINANIKLKQGTGSELTASPLDANEPGYDTDQNRLIVGNTYYAKSSEVQASISGINITYTGNLFRPIVLSPTVSVIQVNTSGNSTLNLGKAISCFNVSNYSEVTGFSGLTSLAFNDLETIGEINQTLSTLVNLSFPSLKYILGNTTGGFGITGTYSLLSVLNLPELIYCYSINITAPNLVSLNLPKLEYVTLAFLSTLVSCTSINVPLLKISPGLTLFSSNFPLLDTLNLPSIQYLLSNMTLAAPNLATFSLGVNLKGFAGNFTATGLKLNQASVDNILIRLAALDGTNGTILYGTGKTINLSGGTSSAPSSIGLTAKSTLQARGVTVTTN